MYVLYVQLIKNLFYITKAFKYIYKILSNEREKIYMYNIYFFFYLYFDVNTYYGMLNISIVFLVVFYSLTILINSNTLVSTSFYIFLQSFNILLFILCV